MLIKCRFKPFRDHVRDDGDFASSDDDEDSPLRAIAQSLCQGLLVNMKSGMQQRQLDAKWEDLLGVIDDRITEQDIGHAIIQHVSQLIASQISNSVEQMEQSNT